MQFFTNDFFAGNRQRLAAGVRADLVVIAANAQLQRSADWAYQFQQDSNFWYLTGCEEPEAVLVIDVKKGTDYIILPKQNEYIRIFDGVSNADEIKAQAGVATVYNYEAGWAVLEKQLKKTKKLATCLPADEYIDVYAMYANPARRRLFERMEPLLPPVHEIIDVRLNLARLRSVKQTIEIKAIQKAVAISIKSFQDTFKAGEEPFTYEYEVEAALASGFRLYGGGGNAYEPIVAGAANACTLHYSHNDAKLKRGSILLIDAAAQYQHYAADITRVYSLGEPTERQKAIHKAVQTVQRQQIKLLKPGIIFKEFLMEAEHLVGLQLKKLGLITDLERESIRKYYPHSTSHFLGIDVHDAGDYEAPLQPGMVLTVEPGIYIPEEGIGVRIEDDLLITATGARNLSAALPTDILEI